MIKYLKYLILLVFLPSSINAQDVIDTLIAWPVDDLLNDSYTFFDYDDTELDTAKYNLGTGGIDDTGTPFTSGGIWRYFPTGYIQTDDYFEVNMTSKSSPSGKQIELTSIEFQMATRVTTRPIRNFFLAYSLNSDFSDSTIVYDYPDANISTTSIASPGIFDYSFETPIVLEAGESVYIRFYPYNAWSATHPQMILIKNTFFIMGIVRDQSPAISVSNFAFTRTCVNEGQLTWDLPSGFDSATDTLLIFAKETSVIDQGSATLDPNLDYGTPDTDLGSLDGSVPTIIQYENDADAMLIYRGVETSVDLTNFEDGITYQFAAFVVEGGGTQVYSNATLTNGESPAVLADVEGVNLQSKPSEMIISWILPICYDSVMVVVKESTDAIFGSPSGHADDYAAGVSADYSASTSNFNGVDASDGRVVYVGIGTNVIVTGLSNVQEYNVTIWVENNIVWSSGVFMTGFPNAYEGIITQTKSEDPDFVEFLTLIEVDFSTELYNLANYAACETGRFYIPSVTSTGETYFDALGVVPAGTTIRVYSDAGTDDTDHTDGIVTLYSGASLMAVGGDQVMLYKDNSNGSANPDCEPGSTVNHFVSALNYGNAGWLAPNSGTPVDANTSYAPPSVSNLEMPSTSTPNFSLKDGASLAISGNIEAVHDAISNVSGNWSTGTGSSPSILLKDIFFDQSDFNNGDIILTETTPGELDIDFSALVFDNDADIRYLVVVNEGEAAGEPTDRYTCYTPDTDYVLADSIVTSVSSQYANQDPCGIPVNGNGKVVYIGTSTSSLTITNTPCGSQLFVTVCAIKGNGYTANIGLAATNNFIMGDNATDYYSAGTGNVGDAIWATTPGGTGSVIDITSCATLIIESGDIVTFDEEVRIGSLEIQTGGEAVMVDNIDLIITRDLQADADFIVSTSSRIIFEGFRQSSTIFGEGNIELFEIEVENSFPTTGADKVIVDTNITVVEGIFITLGDLEVSIGDTLTLASRAANKAAFLGIIPLGSTVTGTFNVERFLPSLTTGSPAGSGSGWRFTTSPVSGSTFADYDDDLYTTGLIGSDMAEFPYNFDPSYYYFPSLQKYDETVAGTQDVGFDGDHDTGAGAPNIRNRRTISTATIGTGEGIFSYVWSTPLTMDFAGTPNQGDIEVPLTYTSQTSTADDGWNLIANPYPCPVSLLSVGIGPGSVDEYIQLYNAETGQFVPKSRFSAATVVAASQGFWAKASTGNPEFEFTEDDKVENSTMTFFKSGEELANTLIIDMEMDTNAIFNDRTVICFDDNATADFEGTHDAYKKYALRPEVSGISTMIDGFDWDVSINAIPELISNVEIPVKVSIRTAGDYTLNFSQTGNYILGSCLTMHDLVLDSVVNIEMNSSYSFYSELRSEDETARFLLTMSPPISVEATDAMCFDGNDGSAVAMGVGDGPFTYTWLDANNEEIMSETISGASILNDLAYGFYSVVIDGNETNCAISANEFTISQPAAYENEWSKIDPSCNINDGSVTLLLDLASSWDISWVNTSTGQNGQVLDKNEAYIISGLSVGEWEITTNSDCGPQSFTVELQDLNPVIADFTMLSETVSLVDGEILVEFTNTSESATNYSWFYTDEQEEEDNSVNGSYVFTSPGIYGISLLSENADGCYDDITYELIVVDPTGVEELSNGVIRSYIAYGSGNPQLVLELTESKDVQIQMVNTMGQVINIQDVNVNGKTYIDLPTYDLSGGIYLIITLDDGTRIDTKKLFVR